MELTEAKLDKMIADLLLLCKKNLHSVNEELITKGFKLSLEAHKNHFRASGEPYFLHPYEVTLVVVNEIPLDDISIVSALLHDVVEDTDISIGFIEKEFGKEIAEIVDGVTKIGGVFKGQNITQAENYRKMLLSMVNDVRVILVKFADRLHNMRTLEFVNPAKQRRIASETLEIYAPFANRFGLAKVKWELEDLAFKYLNKDAYNEISKKLKETRKERENYIKKVTEPIKERLDEHELAYDIGGRPKHFYSIYKKMIKQNKPLEDIYDLSAIRIILENNDPNECYYVLGIINQLFKPIPDRFKDFISIPKRNNYQSIHNTVIGHNGKLVEIQIRTRQMHEIAEKGVAAHWKYKENVDSPSTDLEDWVNLIRDIFENASKDEASHEILQSFKLNLYQDEIYVFTPKGDLKILPTDATPVDFAYEIHSKVGSHCIGAKVNGKIVPLSSPLSSGDQVEILSSKNQRPNKSWLQFVQTHKAKSNIRKYIQKEEDRIVETGKEIWERKLKKYKLVFTSDDINKLIVKLKYENQAKFFVAVAQDNVDLEAILNPVELKEDEITEIKFDNFAKFAREGVGEVVVQGEHKGFVYNYAKCCNPIPGDPIVGYITIGEGIKIHRKNCNNLLSLSETSENRLVPVEWPGEKDSFFLAGISIKGEDRPGILKDLSNSIAGFNNTNIKSVNISSADSIFSGHITVYIKDVLNLNKLIERLKKNKGIFSAERFDLHN
ncbi:MAG: bifunctional (p)ppGpp synthetase/guanosine-3',5'-bis(diphosphate) 3'-pyrophosphohydrolase [Melioribacteraceae bacterium]|nr:bifunctional (p)ppGpp synthetase/guanosine-3',5'-bis(diphosphate) 3'-pyrophosphohydrolase [Melioribacteraceae bacterium]